jgi:hypothetical protein
MDARTLSECRAIFTISRTSPLGLGLLQRLARDEALYPPPHHLGATVGDGYGDFPLLTRGASII